VLALLGAVLAAGLFRVRDGEVAVLPAAAGAATVYSPGWHWRLPFGDLVRLPREPVAVRRDLELLTAEGATIVVDAAGRFAIEPGAAAAWVQQAGSEPFVDGVWARLAEVLAPAVRELDPAELFEPATGAAFTARAAEALAAAGVRAEGLQLTVPAERNPVAAAVVKNRLARLASPTGRKVLVVGWDGADWLMIRPLLEQGRLPNLARLIARGVSGELRSEVPLLSPLVWTTIATGKPVVEHGIADFLVRDPASGQLVPISSASRRVHALWTLLPAFDLTTDVVAWWATWPAEPVNGTVVTDRVAYQLFGYEGGESAEGKVYPPEAWDWVKKRLVPAEEITCDEVRRFVDVPCEEIERRWQSLPPERRQEDKVNHLRKILATTRSYQAIGLELLRDQADLTLLYYEGTDTVGHLFARYLPPRLPDVGADDVRRFGRALPEFYVYADQLLGQVLAAADPETTVMLMSDHGFFTGEARPASDPSDFTKGAPQWHRQYGVLVAAGPGIRRGGEVAGASIFDIAPTILAELGLPVPQDMPGRVLPEVVPGQPAPAGSRELASYEVLPRAGAAEQERVASALDEERLRELVALGYISPKALDEHRRRPGGGGGEDGGGDEPAAAAGGAARAAATEQPGDGGGLEKIATEAYNLGRIYQRQGDFEAARRQFEMSIERQPSFGMGYASLAQIEALEGNHSRAFDLLVDGLSKSSSMPRAAITGLVDEAKEAGRLPDAERALAGLHPVYRQDSAYPAAMGWLYEETGRPESALEGYDRALDLDPLDQLSVENKVGLLRKLGREAEARRFLDSRMKHAEGSVVSLNQLAVVAVRQRWPDLAERLLRQVLASDPGNPGVLANLAASLMQQRKTGEALEVMQEAVRRDPGDARNQFNYGAMLAERGQLRDAMSAFETAEANGLRTVRLYLALAKISFRLGDRSRSESELKKALAIEPQNAEAREMLEVLRTG
jgi:Tfp pilus assembly protein PilF/predicted AlkP superfamily pyrophosphatase or phosphodiesterase